MLCTHNLPKNNQENRRLHIIRIRIVDHTTSLGPFADLKMKIDLTPMRINLSL